MKQAADTVNIKLEEIGKLQYYYIESIIIYRVTIPKAERTLMNEAKENYLI